jgi:hypothetical protein
LFMTMAWVGSAEGNLRSRLKALQESRRLLGNGDAEVYPSNCVMS